MTADKPKKKRISTLAKTYGVGNELMLQLLAEAGEQAKSSASMIDSEAFAKIKPALLREKERVERREMAKAGIKIPMKAVLKKVEKAEIKKPELLSEVKEIIPEPVHTAPAPPLPASEPPAMAIQSEEGAAVRDTSGQGQESAEQQVPANKEEAIPLSSGPELPPELSSEDSKAELKVTIEKPDEQLAARIQKYVAEKDARKVKTAKGYSGKFGKVPPPKRPKRTETSSGQKFQDVFSVRAQQAGVVFPVGEQGKAAGSKDFLQKKKLPRKRGGRRKSKEQIEQELSAAKTSVSKVLATLDRSSQKTKYRKDKGEEQVKEETKTLAVAEFITISELAGLMNVMPNQVIAKCMELGMMVTINQRLDHETIAIIADEFHFKVNLMEEYEEEIFADEDEEEDAEKELRAPIITIMGHVDHGKTSVLDFIRKSNIVSGESGGITQHIGAYSVETPSGRVCFLDTPGHQAFAAMRSRGAQVTDIVVLVVAADSMVMPQTKEAIQHARAANVQIVVAINKIDLPNANPDKIKSQLAEEGVQVEDWGGNIPCVEISAKTGQNMDKLLETLAVSAEILELTASPSARAKGTVIESRLDKGKGAVANILVQDGTLKVGDAFICGSYSGRVRSLLNEFGKKKDFAGPSTPIQVLGLEGMPQAGDSFTVMESEREAREVAMRRREAAKDRELRQKRHITLDQLHEQIAAGEFHELKIIVKGDVDGSVEAICTSLENLSTPEVKVNIINRGVGAVKEADIHLASSSDGIIVAFHTLPSESVRRIAEEEGVTINYYRVIYEVVDEVRAAMEGLLNPEFVEQITGEAKILQLFKVPKIGMIAGSIVTSGAVDRDAQLRLYRGGIEIGEARVTSLKRLKDDQKSVRAGLECGIGIEGLKDLQVDDVLAFFKKVKVARKLSSAINAG